MDSDIFFCPSLCTERNTELIEWLIKEMTTYQWLTTQLWELAICTFNAMIAVSQRGQKHQVNSLS